MSIVLKKNIPATCSVLSLSHINFLHFSYFSMYTLSTNPVCNLCFFLNKQTILLYFFQWKAAIHFHIAIFYSFFYLKNLSRNFLFFFICELLIKTFRFLFINQITFRCCVLSCNSIKIPRYQFLLSG